MHEMFSNIDKKINDLRRFPADKNTGDICGVLGALLQEITPRNCIGPLHISRGIQRS